MIYLNDNIDGFDWQAALPLMSQQRREVCLKYKFEQGRKTCAAAYMLLCEGLRKEYGIAEPPVFEYGEHGKPSIVGHPEIFFNLSHCKEAAICVLSHRPVGVDVESIGRYSDSLARYTMNDMELKQIDEAENRDVEFIRLWTQKEAILKLAGTGIIDDLKHALEGVTVDETVINEEKGYIYSIIYGQ